MYKLLDLTGRQLNNKTMNDEPVTKKDLDEAVSQIPQAILKALEGFTTKDDLKNFITKPARNTI